VPIPIPQYEDEAEDFDPAKEEQTIIRQILDSNKALIIDGTWNNFEEGITETLDGAAVVQLLADARRPPEMVVVLKCSEQSSTKRMIDDQALHDECDKANAIRDEKIEKEKQRQLDELKAENAEKIKALDEQKEQDPDGFNQEDYDQALKDNQAAVDEKQKELDEQEDDSWDAELVGEKLVFQDKKDAKLEELQGQRDADAEWLEAFTEALVEKNLPVIKEIKTDISAEFVHIKLVDQLKDHFQLRQSLIERQQVKVIGSKNLKFYEESFTYKQSKFGLNCPINQAFPENTKDFAVLYRERIYYPHDLDSQQQFLQDPARFTQGVEAVPKDVPILPTCVVLGPAKSGKSTLCQ